VLGTLAESVTLMACATADAARITLAIANNQKITKYPRNVWTWNNID
jgi:hypothetical protein